MNQHENFQVQNLDDNMKRKFGLSTENLKMKNWFTSRWVDAYSEDKICVCSVCEVVFESL